MPMLIHQTRDGAIIEFDKGTFDHWCVFITYPGLLRYPPKDIEYFAALQQLGSIHGHARIYNDFISIYSLTDKSIDRKVLELIQSLSATYGADASAIELWFAVIYAGMIAEENKVNAILKKRVKRLGMQQILLESKTAEYAANFSKGKKWQELDTLMKQRGF